MSMLRVVRCCNCLSFVFAESRSSLQRVVHCCRESCVVAESHSFMQSFAIAVECTELRAT